ncbi:hypothetical protein AB6A40_001607 [Gnathostoma spinigerum]|uniref:TFIIS N-terminal domain-containing protein n=1 Tax=Gnathostoma spinigerum TaxID=75299 RepID=A0ABD6E4Q0_9BILA
MSDETDVRAKVERYVRMLSNEDKIAHALKRLSSITMTVELLSETGVGKAVNQHRYHARFGDEAQKLVEKWKEMARNYGLKQKRRHSPSPVPSEERSPSPRQKIVPKKSRRRENDDKSHRTFSNEKFDSNTEIKSSEAPCSSESVAGPSTSGASGVLSFADMLAMADTVKPSKPKKIKLDIEEWKSSEIDLNYKPSKVLNYEAAPVQKEHKADNSALDAAVFKPRKDARRVYAGRKGNQPAEIPTLESMCLKVIGNNIDAYEELGDASFDILKPVLERCTPEQLSHIEKKNPHLIEECDVLWEKIVARLYPKAELDEYETWKECYERSTMESDYKLKMLSNRITQHSKESHAPVRKALLAEAKAPREVRQRQLRNGTYHSNQALPGASEISQARRAIFERGEKGALSNLPVSVRNTSSSLGAHSSKKKESSRKGALMVKTLKMLKDIPHFFYFEGGKM